MTTGSADDATSPQNNSGDRFFNFVERGNHRISVEGGRTHNLKSISVDVPKNSLVVFTGVSGSGKSSLCFDTIYAEAHRRQLQSMSGMARQLFGELERADVDRVTGLSPALALEQDRVTTTPRSTVGTATDVYAILRILLASNGVPVCLVCNAAMPRTGTSYACPEGHDSPLPQMTSAAFSFNSPTGACQSCNGLGIGTEIDLGAVIPDEDLSIEEGALAPWRGPLQEPDKLVACQVAIDQGCSPKSPWSTLTNEARKAILYAEGRPTTVQLRGRSRETLYNGVLPWLRSRLAHATQAKQMMAYTRSGWCDECSGSRLSRTQSAVRLAGISVTTLVHLELSDLLGSPALTIDMDSPDIATECVIAELRAKVQALVDIGLGYLTLARSTPSLSGGEGQRLRLATQLTTDLSGLIYVLDEPSSGLHSDDVTPVLAIIRDLRDLGNSVLVVDHDQQVISAADWVVELGPDAGAQGGQITFNGPASDYLRTDAAVNRRSPQHSPPSRPLADTHPTIRLRGARGQNLDHVNLDIPLERLTTVLGRSGSGKSTLIGRTFYPAIAMALGKPIDGIMPEPYASISGYDSLRSALLVDQTPIGRNRRSNAATYVGAFDGIRATLAGTPEAQACGIAASHFGFNSPGGRCEECKGEGTIAVDLSFMPTAALICPTCKGSRYQASTLDIRWKQHSVADILAMLVSDACQLFAEQKSVHSRLAALNRLGLGYLPLGQPAPTLSGGEAQRVKLAAELGKPASGNTLYVVDEPTRGLHSKDVECVLEALNALVTEGNTVVAVTHNNVLAVSADWTVELGPGGGSQGGHIQYQGPPHKSPRRSGLRKE